MQTDLDLLSEDGICTMHSLIAIRGRRMKKDLISRACQGNRLSKEMLDLYCSRYFRPLLFLCVAILLDHYRLALEYPNISPSPSYDIPSILLGVMDLCLIALIIIVGKDIRQVGLALRHIIEAKKHDVYAISFPKTWEDFAEFVDELLIEFHSKIVYYDLRSDSTAWKKARADFEKVFGAAKVLGFVAREETSFYYELRVLRKLPMSVRPTKA